MTEAEKASIAKKQIVAHRKDGQNHDARKHALMIYGQQKIECGQQRDYSDMQ